MAWGVRRRRRRKAGEVGSQGFSFEGFLIRRLFLFQRQTRERAREELYRTASLNETVFGRTCIISLK